MTRAETWLRVVHFETNISSTAGGFTCLNYLGRVKIGNCRLLIFVHFIDIMLWKCFSTYNSHNIVSLLITVWCIMHTM
jgi:hypothetical protein